jgi:hypothetical protein
MEPEDRLDAIATEIRPRVSWPDNAEGVVLSSGPAVSFGAPDPDAETITTRTAGGTFLRRLLSPHLIRETFIVALRDDAVERSDWWASAYDAEPSWLDADLTVAGHPEVRQLWRQ